MSVSPAPRARSLRPFARLPGAALAGLTLGVTLGWCWGDGPEPPPTGVEQVRRAVLEARTNCLLAALARQGLPAPPPRYSTRELLLALETEDVVAASYGELPALRREARWLATLRAGQTVAPRSREDVRFLLGAIHSYVEAALPPGETRHRHTVSPEDYGQDALRVYRGMDFGDLLGLWD